MKNIPKAYIVCCITLTLMMSCAPGPDPQNIRWFSIDEGLKIASEEGKKAFLYFRADWWPYCRKLDQVLAQPKIRTYLNDHFIPIRVDFDREKEIVKQYNVQGIPDIWFLDSRGKRLKRATGFVSEKILLSVLKYIKTDSYKTMSFNAFNRQGWYWYIRTFHALEEFIGKRITFLSSIPVFMIPSTSQQVLYWLLGIPKSPHKWKPCFQRC